MEEILLKDVIYKRIKERIVNGEFAMGSKLSEVILEETLQANKAPIRDALKRLEAEHLVVRKPKSGTYVFSICQKDLDKLLEFRFVLEFEAYKSALKNKKSLFEQELHMALDRLTVAFDNQNTRDYLKEDSGFHQTAITLWDNQYFSTAYTSIAPIMDTVRNTLTNDNLHFGRSQEQHKAIVEAVHNNDLENIYTLLQKHILPDHGAFWNEDNIKSKITAKLY